MTRPTDSALRRLQSIGALPPSLLGTTREDPRLLESVRTFLRTPRPYRVVEDVEEQLLSLWHDVLSLHNSSEKDLLSFAWFFSNLGFLYKYKVYGLKMALPFGYSVFDLQGGSGFSFQIHVEPKLEGFHILKVKPSALLYLADMDEWRSQGLAWAQAGFNHLVEDDLPAGALTPREGDVVAVEDTETVHTVLGCVLEEYASCSVDSVVRLFDQNRRGEVPLPTVHPRAETLLNSGSTSLPQRHLRREGNSWAETAPQDEGSVITTVHVRGRRAVVDGGRSLVHDSNKAVTSIVVVHGTIHASSSSMHITRGPGEVLVVPPGLQVELQAQQRSTIAIHEVPSDMASYHWTR